MRRSHYNSAQPSPKDLIIEPRRGATAYRSHSSSAPALATNTDQLASWRGSPFVAYGSRADRSSLDPLWSIGARDRYTFVRHELEPSVRSRSTWARCF